MRHTGSLISLIALACACSSGGHPATTAGATGGSTGTAGSSEASTTGSGTGARGASSSSTSGTSGGTTGPAFSEAPHNPFPQVPYQGGLTISTPDVWTISFSDDPWADAEVGWAKWVVGSEWLSEVGKDYGIRSGTFMGSVALTQAAPKVSSDADLQNLLSGLFASNALPAPTDGNAIYLVYYPYGASLTGPNGTGTSCSGFLGYHSVFTYEQTSVIYTVVVDCGQADDWNEPQPAANEIGASHELMEAASDPLGVDYIANGDPTVAGYIFDLSDPSNPWLGIGDEIPDLCEWTSFEDVDAGFWAQRIYSNSEAALSVGSPCVPVPPGEAFEGVSGPVYTLAVSQGLSTTAYFNTWSSGPTADWCLEAFPQGGFYLGNGAILYLDGGATVNNGSAVALPIAVPAAPAAGQTGTVWMATEDCATQAIQSIWPLYVETPPVGLPCQPLGSYCDVFGLLCEALSTSGSVCQYPPEFGECQPLVGCSEGYACEPVQSPEGQEFTCLASCNTSADCTDPDSTCQQNGSNKLCVTQYCGPGTSNGTALFGMCTSSDGGGWNVPPGLYTRATDDGGVTERR